MKVEKVKEAIQKQLVRLKLRERDVHEDPS